MAHVMVNGKRLLPSCGLRRQRQIVSSGRSLVWRQTERSAGVQKNVSRFSCRASSPPFILWFRPSSLSCLPSSILCKHEKRSVQTRVKRQDVTKDWSSPSLAGLETRGSL